MFSLVLLSPYLAIHRFSKHRLTPWLCATSNSVAPSTPTCAVIAAFSTRVHDRRGFDPSNNDLPPQLKLKKKILNQMQSSKAVMSGRLPSKNNPVSALAAMAGRV